MHETGYDVITATNGIEAIEQTQAQEPDMIVLDVMMPVKDGFEALKEIRGFSSVPIIMLSAKNDDSHKIKGFAMGADDYLGKPFHPDELLARIESIKRRVISSEARDNYEQLTFGNIIIDFNKRSVLCEQQEIHLSRIEWLLLSELARNNGKLILHNDLLAKVWGPGYRNDVQLSRTWISRLRKKLDKKSGTGNFIRMVAKTGYILDHENTSP